MNKNQNTISGNDNTKSVVKSNKEDSNPLKAVNISKPTPRIETRSLHDDKKETRAKK